MSKIPAPGLAGPKTGADEVDEDAPLLFREIM